jgi:hypothetical protein
MTLPTGRQAKQKTQIGSIVEKRKLSFGFCILDLLALLSTG